MNFLEAINSIEYGQYLKVTVRNPPSDFKIYQIKIWNHGLKYRGLLYQYGGREIMYRLPMFAQEVVSMITYLGISRENAQLRHVDSPFMRDLNREWYFTANPNAGAKTIADFESHSSEPEPVRSPAASEDISTPAASDPSQLVCPECQSHLTLGYFEPTHDLGEAFLQALTQAWGYPEIPRGRI